MTVLEKQIYFRIIALWVVCEAMLGGIIHGFKLPVSGLIVGSSAIVCIALLGLLIPTKGAILKATMVVVVFKMLLSPQSPFAAYIAVLFQGVLGHLLFSNKKHFILKCYIFAFLALIESALQRVIVMTIVFGANLWEAFNEFSNKLLHSTQSLNYSLYIVTGYLFLHIIVAFFVGRFASQLPALLSNLKSAKDEYEIFHVNHDEATSATLKRRNRSFIFIVWIFFAAVYIHSQFYPHAALLPKSEVLLFVFRSALILLTWYYLIAPLLLKILQKFLDKQKAKLRVEIEETMLLLPTTKVIIKKSWEASRKKSRGGRLLFFWRSVIANTLIIQ